MRNRSHTADAWPSFRARSTRFCAILALTLIVLGRGQPLRAAAPLIELLGTGAVPGSASDGSKLAPPVLEDGTPQDRAGGFGSAISYTGHGNRYLATADRGPGNGMTSYVDRFYLLDIAVVPGGAEPVTVAIVATTPLVNEQGQSFTGSVAAFDASNSPASRRLDPEGVRVAAGGHFFVSDEYGPFVYEFDEHGKRVRSLAVPDKFLIKQASASSELPPTNVKGRQANRGMEGLALSADGRKLYGILQSPLIQDGALDSSNERIGRNDRILEIDVASGATRELLYQFDDQRNGVSEILALDDGRFLVLERDSKAGSAAAFKKIFLVDAAAASDISNLESLPTSGTPAGVTPVKKALFLDLLDPALGIDKASLPEKLEGLTFGPDLADGRKLLLVTVDNDFVADKPSLVYAFAVSPQALAGAQL